MKQSAIERGLVSPETADRLTERDLHQPLAHRHVDLDGRARAQVAVHRPRAQRELVHEEAEAQVVTVRPKGKWPLLLAIPEQSLSTEAARSVLPKEYSRADVVVNIQNSMLLLAAIAGCYTTTVRAIAGGAQFDFTDLQVEASGTVRKAESGYSFAQITVRPNLKIASSDERDKALELLKRAEKLCLVSRAMGTTLKFEPQLEITKPASIA